MVVNPFTLEPVDAHGNITQGELLPDLSGDTPSNILLRLDRAADRLPGIKTTPKSIRLLKTLFAENLRRTGAVLLVRSSSVRNGQPVFRPRGDDVPVGRPNADRPADFERDRFPSFVIPYIQERNRHTGL
jgi:hypothetical protein